TILTLRLLGGEDQLNSPTRSTIKVFEIGVKGRIILSGRNSALAPSARILGAKSGRSQPEPDLHHHHYRHQPLSSSGRGNDDVCLCSPLSDIEWRMEWEYEELRHAK